MHDFLPRALTGWPRTTTPTLSLLQIPDGAEVGIWRRSLFISPQRCSLTVVFGMSRHSFGPRAAHIFFHLISVSAPPPRLPSAPLIDFAPMTLRSFPPLFQVRSACASVTTTTTTFPFLKFSRLPSFLPDGRLVRRHQTACIFSSATDGGPWQHVRDQNVLYLSCRGPEWIPAVPIPFSL